MGHVRSINSDQELGAPDGVDEHAGIGEEVLHGGDTLKHVLSDRELPLGFSQGVDQRTDDVGEAGQEKAI